MPNFAYRAFNPGGKAVSGDIEADSAQMAAEMLFSKGFVPSDVRENTPIPRPGLMNTVS